MLRYVCISSLLVLFAYKPSLVSAERKTELQYVQILFRHGDRAPIDLYPTDPNLHYKWPEGLAKLTPLGKKQHYIHGKTLRKLYADFITTNPSEIDVISSAVDRCMRSVETNLASFYAPRNKWKFESDFDWQPLPVRYIPVEEDKYLEASSYCPRADIEEQKVINSPGGQQIIKDNWEMFRNLTLSSGKNISTWKTASYLFDVLMIEKKYNLTTPSWAEAYWNQLKKVHVLSFYWNFNSPVLLRLRAGPLLGLIIGKMENKIYNKSFTGKVQIYSAHDTNIAVVLHALNLFNMIPPPYCATLLFELHKVDGDYAVRLMYLNSSTPESGDQIPHVLILEGCSEFCPLGYFKNYSKHLIPEDWEAECGMRGFIKDQCFIAKNFVIGLGVALAMVTILVMYQSAKLKSQEQDERVYRLLPTAALAL